MNTQIIPGSIGALARQGGKSIAETFMSADCICIVDVSGSMAAHDSRDGMSRYDVACDELAALQNSLPGKIAVISFSDRTKFCPNGTPGLPSGTTDLAGALKFARVADVPGMRFIVISDGEPDDANAALREAAKYKNRIDTIFVGPERNPHGRDFLECLAKASGGQAIIADLAKELKAGVERLLLKG